MRGSIREVGDPCILHHFPYLEEVDGKMFVPEKKFHHLDIVTQFLDIITTRCMWCPGCPTCRGINVGGVKCPTPAVRGMNNLLISHVSVDESFTELAPSIRSLKICEKVTSVAQSVK